VGGGAAFVVVLIEGREIKQQILGEQQQAHMHNRPGREEEERKIKRM